MNAKHTPKPWKVVRWAEDLYPGAPLEILHDEGTGVAVTLATITKGPEDECDAQLMASAPDLLEALQVAEGVLVWAKDHGAKSIDPVLRMARAAIAKATGATS